MLSLFLRRLFSPIQSKQFFCLPAVFWFAFTKTNDSLCHNYYVFLWNLFFAAVTVNHQISRTLRMFLSLCLFSRCLLKTFIWCCLVHSFRSTIFNWMRNVRILSIMRVVIVLLPLSDDVVFVVATHLPQWVRTLFLSFYILPPSVLFHIWIDQNSCPCLSNKSKLLILLLVRSCFLNNW